jgi:hypothetical protein
MRKLPFLAALCLLFLPLAAMAQDELNTVTCTFNDGKSVSISFKAPAKGEKLPNNSVYTPGGSPMALLTETPLRFGNAPLPTGGYNVYVIPAKAKWTLVINKGVKDATYDSTKDVARVQMDSGTIPGATASPFTVYLDHSGPKQCSVRIYNDKTGYFADLMEE